MTIVPLTTILGLTSDNGVRWKTDPDIPENEGWHRFVLDHKEQIMASATPTVIPPNIFSEVRYDLARFFRQQNITPQYLWVTRLINPNLSDITFDRVRLIYIPELATMRQLFEQYKASSSIVARPSGGY